MRRCADPRGCAKRLSVSKMPHAGKHHRNLMFIRGGNDFIVANRPSRLNHTARACGRNNSRAIPEREKGIRCDRKARFLWASILRFAASDTRCIEAAHLTRANSIGHAARTKDNGVGFHELRDLPYKAQVVHFLRAWMPFCHDAPFVRLRLAGIEALHEQAAADSFEVDSLALTVHAGEWNFKRAQMLFGSKPLSCFVAECGRDQHFN